MKIKQSTAEKDPDTGRNKILVEIDSNDIEIIEEALRQMEQSGRFDPDDRKYKEKFDHVAEQMHKTRGLLRPS